MPKSWERVFIGRDQELDSLASIWQDVRAGSPRLAVILGETGLGKTRLVQQFYECIAAEETQSESMSSAYWPPQLSVGRNLSLQPKIQNDSADIPWLWWAMRFPFPSRRNDLGFVSPFEAQDKNLAANAEPILRKRNRRQVNIDASLTFSTIIADIASVGLVGSALSLFDLYKARQLERANADKSITELEIERVRELVDKTLSVLRLFMDAKQADSPQVPVIIVLDDAQWIDSLSLQALFHIFAEAKSNQWPLMVLATHWEKEWNEAEPKLESDFEFRQLRQVYEHFEHEDEQLGHLLNLSKISTQHLHQIVEQALPGVAIGERDMLV
ncbi:MAG TPA: ATP-binding protein, partial [Pseudidiomarina sp.]|nr:ATP-binding protein [Pseudidiomarina sp.]